MCRLKSYHFVLYSILLLSTLKTTQAQSLFSTDNGKVSFKSEAPLELIQATSEELRGLIDPEKRTFAFTVKIATLEGFNSKLQQVHFNENYMESHKYPSATFSGKFIEPIDFKINGEHIVRAKGKLTIHGIEQERIIKGRILINGETIEIESSFIVLLEEHGIAIPKVVFNKISEEILVNINSKLTKKN